MATIDDVRRRRGGPCTGMAPGGSRRKFTWRGSLIIAAPALVAALTGCGGTEETDAEAEVPTRSIEIDMVDNAFVPSSVSVASGETVRFVFTNRGEQDHDAFIGAPAAQAEHEADMRAGEGDEHAGHSMGARPTAITVEPGDTGELIYRFEAGAEVEIGCHQPGHYDAGMRLAIVAS